MSSPTLNPIVRCWGRGDEISYLLRPIHDEPRSLTLIWGDSGIGKTALLQEFHRTVGGGDYLAGFYQCQRDTGTDPLLKCLQKLIDDRVYTIDEWPQVMIEGLQRVKGRLQNPRQVGRLLGGAFGAVEKAPVVGKWAQVVSKGLGAVAELAGPGISLPAEMTQRLAPEVFADVVDVLQAAFRDRPLVFILDNLSADAESQAQIAGVTHATNALLSFVDTHFLVRRNLHFVLSWKHIAKTRPSFQELRTTIRQYQGRDRELGTLSDSFVQEWAGNDFDWFREASPEQQKQAVDIAKGLPEAVSQWKELGVDSFDAPRLEEITDDVVKGRYAPLAAELRDEKTTDDQPWLFQLSIMPGILTEHGLGQLWDCPTQVVHRFLRKWCDRALLKTEDGRYLFAHEKKQEVTRKALGEELVQNGREQAQALYDFYRSNVGFPNDAHPEAGFYLAFASALGPWAALSASETELLEQPMWLLMDSGPVPEIGAAGLAEARKAPWNARFFLFHRAASRLPETGPLLEALEPELFDDSAAAEADPLNLAKGLVNAANAYGDAGRLEEVERLLGRLEALAAKDPEQGEVAVALAKGLVNAANAYGDAGRLEEVKKLLGRLEALAKKHPEQGEIAVESAKGLFNATNAYGNAGRLEEVKKLLGRLEALAKKHPEQDEVAVALAKGLFNATTEYGNAGRLEEVKKLLGRLEALAKKHPEQDEIAVRLAAGLVNATNAYGNAGRLEEVKKLLGRLEALAKKHPEQGEIAVESAKGLFNATNAYGNAGRLEEVKKLLGRLEALAKKHPEQDEVAVALAKGLFNATTEYGNAGRLEEVKKLLGRLEALAKKHPEQDEIAVRLANGLVNATNAYGNAGRLEEVKKLLGRLEALAKKHPEQGEIAVESAKGLFNATNAYGNAGRLEELKKLLGRLEALAKKHPEQDEIAVRLAKGLVNATNAYGNAGRLEEVQRLLERLEALAKKHPEQGEIAALLAKGLFNATNAYGNAGRLEEVERLLGRLEALAKKHPEQGEIHVALANGLVTATIAYGNAGRLEEVERLLGRLEALAKKHPEQGEIHVALANGLVTATIAYGNAGRLEEVERLLGRLDALAKKHPDDAGIASAKALGLIQALRLGLGDREKNGELLGHLLGRFGDTEAFQPVAGSLAQLDQQRQADMGQEKGKEESQGSQDT